MSQKSHIFSIVGTTSVGKSDATLNLAKYLIDQKLCTGVSIISADSRQVYQGLEILSGADIPDDFERTHYASIINQDSQISAIDFLQKDAIKIFGLSSIKVTEDWSVSQFHEFAQKIMKTAFSRGEIVLVVGGTGLYHQHLLTTDPQLSIPPNLEIRKKAETLTLPELQVWLAEIQPTRFADMNNSDKHNSRRLVRAIEIAVAISGVVSKIGVGTGSVPRTRTETNISHHYLGLQIFPEQLLENIQARVEKRFKDGTEKNFGVIAEVKSVLKQLEAKSQLLSISTQVTGTLGFKEVKEYIEGTTTTEECQKAWILAEHQYAKRQITWWKKQTNIQWFDKNQSDWFVQMTDVVTKLLTDK